MFQREPRWRPARAVSAAAAFRSWLLEPGSLTARLRAAVGPNFGVRLLGQGFSRPFSGEAGLLCLPTRRIALAREVLLQGDGAPLVLARTVIPPKTLRGEHCSLARLGNRPLGEVLFAQRGLVRPSLEFACINPSDWQPAIAKEYGLQVPVWGRRSLYEVGEDSLLVCEFFLPAVVEL